MYIAIVCTTIMSSTSRTRTSSLSNTTSTRTASDLDPPIYTTPNQRTLADIRDQVARELAVRAISKAETVDGVKVGVMLPLSKEGDKQFLRTVASNIKHILLLRQYLFAVATTGHSAGYQVNSLVICGSSEALVQKAISFTNSKFLERIVAESNE